MEPECDEVECIVENETLKSFLLRDASNTNRVGWFPKSEVSFSRRNKETNLAVAVIPLWLLTKKGWNE